MGRKPAVVKAHRMLTRRESEEEVKEEEEGEEEEGGEGVRGRDYLPISAALAITPWNLL
jgi:hypothetical protein